MCVVEGEGVCVWVGGKGVCVWWKVKVCVCVRLKALLQQEVYPLDKLLLTLVDTVTLGL